MKPYSLFFDGECNLCHRSQLRVVRWADRAGVPLEVETLQGSPYAEAGAMVLTREGREWRGVAAWAEMTRWGPWPVRVLGSVSKIWPFSWVATGVYQIIARNRYRWFGRRSCPLRPPSDSAV